MFWYGKKSIMYSSSLPESYIFYSAFSFILSLALTAVFPIPVSYSKKRRAAAEGQAVFPTKRPDADNIAKAVCDALNGTAYGDDAQIVRLQVKKVYGEPHLMVLIGEEEHDGTGEENADQQREDGLGDAAGGV